MTDQKRNIALLVLGMHRSGTSALTGALSLAGANPGPSLMPAVAEVNPKGFWEHQEIVAIHENLLAALNSGWDDERPLPDGWWDSQKVLPFRSELLAILRRDFSASPLWLLKDPRLCRLLPLWRALLGELGIAPCFVICLRHPGEVAMSLERRDGIPAERACLLWLEHLVESERDTRDLPRIAVTYEQLLSDWHSVLQRIATHLDLHLSLDNATADRIAAFLEPELRHHRHAQTGPAEQDRGYALACEAYSLAAGGNLDAAVSRLTAIGKETESLVERVAPWSAEIRVLKQENAKLERQSMQLEALNADLQTEIDRIKATVSWQVTKPLRLLAFLWRKLVRAGRAA